MQEPFGVVALCGVPGLAPLPRKIAANGVLFSNGSATEGVRKQEEVQ